MGNSAVIFFEDHVTNNAQNKYVGIYVHWNGSPESVYAYLEYMKEAGVRYNDEAYARACFTQIVRNFFGGILSVGVECYTLDEACNMGDNGVYVVKWRAPDYRVDRYKCNGVKFTQYEVDEEKVLAMKSAHWTNTPNIMDDLHKKNDRHFVSN